MNHRELIAALTPQVGAGEARAIVRMVMEERFGLSQVDLLLGKDTTLSADDRKDFEKIASRLLRGEPVQYVLGYACFLGHRFRVTPNVLIPRPETEELVRWAIGDVAAQAEGLAGEPLASSITIFDLCTGSGCIAVSMALAFPEARVVGIDVSPGALAVARENAAALGAGNVEFFQQDLLLSAPASSSSVPSPSTLSSCASCPSPLLPPVTIPDGNHATILLSNPPYVRTSEASGMTSSVLDHEPHLALFVPDGDPLRFYRAIGHVARRVLLPGSPLYLEMNAALSEETRQLFLSLGFRNVEVRNDQFDRPRFIKATS